MGRVGTGGKGGNCRRLRAARLTSMLEDSNATRQAKVKQEYLKEEAIII